MITELLTSSLLVVVLAERLVFRCVGVEELQWVHRRVIRLHDLKVAQDLGERNLLEVHTGEGLHRPHVGHTCRNTTHARVRTVFGDVAGGISAWNPLDMKSSECLFEGVNMLKDQHTESTGTAGPIRFFFCCTLKTFGFELRR